MRLNYIQTPIESLELDKAPQEIQDQFYDIINNIPFVRRLIAEDRPRAKDLERDKDGKIIVDITKPHILENMDYFRQTAIHYQKYGTYTNLRPNLNPNSDYGKWFIKETKRCWYGMVRPEDGEWVTGDYYYLLNYTPILLTKDAEDGSYSQRVIDFPRVWEGHYYKYHYLDQARKSGHHAAELARRSAGKSISVASMMAKRFVLGESKEVCKKVTCYITATDKAKLVGGDQTLDKFQFNIDFMAENTEYPNRRLINSIQNMSWQMGYLDLDSGAKKGTLNSVVGKSSQADASKLRGSRGVLYIFEESGCHIGGTEVLMYDTSIKKVEDIQIGDLLMGPDGKPRKVLKTYSGRDMMYKVTMSNGDWQIVNSRHPIRYIQHYWYKDTDIEMLATAPELLMKKKRQLDGCYIEKASIIYPYKKITLDPYYLGLFLGDGYKGDGSIANEDSEVIEWLCNKYDCSVRDLKHSKKCKNIYIKRTTNDVFKQLKEYNLINNKHIPNDFIYNSPDVGLQLLAGLIDTDGTYTSGKTRHYFEITQRCDRKHILDAAKAIATNLGFRCSMTTRISTGKKPGVLHYRLRISGDLYKIPTKIKRKQAPYIKKYKQRRDVKLQTFKVEEYAVDKYYGFTLDGDHLFVLKDGTVVHNTYSNLLETYSNLRPSVEDGGKVFGLLYLIGCCCAGTTVLKENGEPINIEDININDRLIGYNGNNSTIENISFKKNGPKQCLHIKASKNNEIKCSVDHPLMALNKDKFGHTDGTCSFYLASELKVGDTLIVPRRIGRFGDIHEKDSFLLGALFGDGSYSKNSSPTLSITSEEEYQYYNNNYDIGISKIKNSKEGIYAQIYFNGLKDLLKKYKMYGQSFDKKELPYNIFDWDKQSVCNFLAGYFTADGNVQMVKRNHRSIKLTCKYYKTLIKIKYLLNKLGITAHIEKECKPERILKSYVNNTEYLVKKAICYVLYINNSEDILIFRENIKLLINNKQDRLNSYIPPKKTRMIGNHLKFKLRWNLKGKNFIGKEFNDVYFCTIKEISDIGIQTVYNMTADTTHTYISNSFLSSNTAGDSESDFSSMQEIMYHPEGYNVHGIQNVFDKEGQGRPRFTYFFPAYLNREGCYDNDGNSDVIKALWEILWDRYKVKYNSSNVNAITKRIAEIPITPQEAILRTRGNIFPVTELNARLAQIDNDPSFYDETYVGELYYDNGTHVSFRPTSDKPIRDFPTKDNKIDGCIEIFKMPEVDSSGKVFRNRYIVSLDPIDADEADTMSLSSTFVLDLWTDTIVAEYTGRMQYAENCYEITRKLCYFYNAKCLYEANIKGFYAYCARMICTHLLAETPEYLKDRDLIRQTGIGNKAYGVIASKPINNYANTLIRDWLLKEIPTIQVIDGEEVETMTFNLNRINNRALLKELILYNPDINVDRIRSLGLLMLYREEYMVKYGGDPRRTKEVNTNYLGNDSFFTRNFDKKFSETNNTIINQ